MTLQEILKAKGLSDEDITSYTGIVDAIDVFDEEINAEKVMFVHPKQTTQLRKDADFISADKYAGNVIMTGEIGMIANARIVPTKKVPIVKVDTVDCYACPIVKLESAVKAFTELSCFSNCEDTRFISEPKNLKLWLMSESAFLNSFSPSTPIFKPKLSDIYATSSFKNGHKKKTSTK